MEILVSFHFSRTAFELKVFAEVDGSMSNWNAFPAPTTADFPSIVGEKYASLAIEVKTTETILREQDLHVFPMLTAPGQSQDLVIGSALVEMSMKISQEKPGIILDLYFGTFVFHH